MTSKEERQLILKQLVDVEKRLGNIEVDISTTKKSLKWFMLIGKGLAVIGGLVLGFLQIYGKGAKGKKGRRASRR